MSRHSYWSALLCLGTITTVGGRAVAQSPARDSISQAPFERELGAGRKPSLPELEPYRLFEAEWGWVVVEDSALAGPIIATMRSSVNRFERIFGKPVGRGLFIVKEEIPAEARETLAEAAGAQWSWQTEVLPPVGEGRKYIFDFIRHELTHHWMATAYPHMKEHVWFDELAGALMQVQRDLNAEKLLSLAPDFVEKYFVPLDTLFVMHNPVNDVVNGAGEAYMLAIYAQFCSVGDFLIERSLDPDVYRSIAEHLERGGRIADWLRTNGPRYTLPTTVAELDQEWRRWLIHNGPNPNAKPKGTMP